MISPLLFNVMINDIFSNVQPGIGKSLFADDGGLWKRGKNVKHIVKKVQECVNQVENWGRKWGFRFSVEKTKCIFFTRKKIEESVKVPLYGKSLERVKCLKFLGVVFDGRLTWKDHITEVIDRSKKVLNVMRCLAGTEWGASKASLRQIYGCLMRSRMEYGIGMLIID